MTRGAAEIELRRQYRDWGERFWRCNTSLAQLVVEEFPDPDDRDARLTRYHLDTLRKLTLQLETVFEGYELEGG